MIWGLAKKAGMALLGGVLDHFKDKRDLKREIELAKLKNAAKQLNADVDWDATMAQGSVGSWKDEWWTIILSIPMVLAFFPGLVDYILAGFKALEQMPEWYMVAVGTAIAAAFGRSELIKWMKRK